MVLWCREWSHNCHSKLTRKALCSLSWCTSRFLYQKCPTFACLLLIQETLNLLSSTITHWRQHVWMYWIRHLTSNCQPRSRLVLTRQAGVDEGRQWRATLPMASALDPISLMSVSVRQCERLCLSPFECASLRVSVSQPVFLFSCLSGCF